MKTMTAARLHGIRDLRLETLPVPTPGPGQVVCRVAYCGICGTDYAIYSGETSFIEKGMIRYPMTLGHEWSGIVTAVGDNVRHVRVGDRVAGDTCVSCDECYHCLMGEYNRCLSLQSVGTVNAWDGGYAEYILMPARHVMHLPDGVGLEQGALMECAATSLCAVKKARVGVGDRVVVTGTGPIGILAAALARLAGASMVIVLGRKAAKLEVAKRLGADVALSTGSGDWAAEIRALAPEGVDSIIEASGSLALLDKLPELIHPSGLISAVAFYERPAEAFDFDRLVQANRDFLGVGCSLGMNEPVLRMMAAGRLRPETIITDRCHFADVVETLATLHDKNESRIKVMMRVAPEL